MLDFKQILIVVFFICVAETAAISCVKKYHDGDGVHFFVGAILLYGIVCYLLNRSFDFNSSMGITNVLWSGLSVVLVLLTGVLFFHEKIHFHDLFAIGLITSGIMIIKYTK